MSRRDLIFRVFVSSTFSDFVAERNVLQEKVFPKLRRYCQRRGARFQAIDLRWGVSQEAALDQQTMNICLQELRRCQEISPKPNFLVLLGNRYGWLPLPPQIDAKEFEALLEHVSANERSQLHRWYRRDDNAVPPEYCLLPREGEFADHRRWSEEETRLRELLLRAVDLVIPQGDLRRRKYEESATHQEIRHGALQVEDARSHVFCYFREIEGLPEDEEAHTYRDLKGGAPDTEAERRLESLKGDLLKRLTAKNVHGYVAKWKGGMPHYDLDALCADVEADLQRVIDQEIESFQREADLEREQRTHREFAEERAAHFVGREDVLQQIAHYVRSDATRPLIIYGRLGCGKTALMGKAWLDLGDELRSVARFIGATPRSSDLRWLLTDLCRALGVEEVPSDINELVKAFRDRLAAPVDDERNANPAEPIVLFLDALDQLNPTENARMLYWLPRELAPNIKLVMSVLQTDQQEENQSAREDPFDLAGRIWPESLVQLGCLDEQEGEALLGAWLDEAGRTLQQGQRAEVLGKFARCPLPLYLKLAFEEARRWKSWDGVPIALRDTVDGILEQLFERLEHPKNHGETLVSRALGYLAAGKNGLTEDELLDVLSRDKGVVSDFAARSPDSPKLKEKDPLPVIVWSRLFADVNRYMTQRRADGTVVLDFYHGQVGDAVRRRYLPSEEALAQAHLHLAEYFDGLEYWAESLEAQRARARRLPPTPRPANVRKVVELPYHRLEVAKLVDPDSSNPDAVYRGSDGEEVKVWDAVADLLTNWQFLEAKAEADPNFQEQESVEPSPATGEVKP